MDNQEIISLIKSSVEFHYEGLSEAKSEALFNLSAQLFGLEGIGIEEGQRVLRPYQLLAEILSILEDG